MIAVRKESQNTMFKAEDKPLQNEYAISNFFEELTSSMFVQARLSEIVGNLHLYLRQGRLK